MTQVSLNLTLLVLFICILFYIRMIWLFDNIGMPSKYPFRDYLKKHDFAYSILWAIVLIWIFEALFFVNDFFTYILI